VLVVWTSQKIPVLPLVSGLQRKFLDWVGARCFLSFGAASAGDVRALVPTVVFRLDFTRPAHAARGEGYPFFDFCRIGSIHESWMKEIVGPVLFRSFFRRACVLVRLLS